MSYRESALYQRSLAALIESLTTKAEKYEQARRRLNLVADVSRLDDQVMLEVKDSYGSAFAWLSKEEAVELAYELINAAQDSNDPA